MPSGRCAFESRCHVFWRFTTVPDKNRLLGILKQRIDVLKLLLSRAERICQFWNIVLNSLSDFSLIDAESFTASRRPERLNRRRAPRIVGCDLPEARSLVPY